MDLDTALKLASQIKDPGTVAVFALTLCAFMFVYILHVKTSRTIRVTLLCLVLAIFLLGVFPLIAQVYVQSRNVYHVRIIVLGLDGVPVEDSLVTSSNGGEAKKVQGGWEFDIPPQSKPANGELTLYASQKSAFLTGTATIMLDKHYFPTIEIQLHRNTSARVSGVVLDERGRSVASARVSLVGFPETTTTNEMGNFELPAHAAEGQSVELRAEKGDLTCTLLVVAGTPVKLVLRRH